MGKDVDPSKLSLRKLMGSLTVGQVAGILGFLVAVAITSGALGRYIGRLEALGERCPPQEPVPCMERYQLLDMHTKADKVPANDKERDGGPGESTPQKAIGKLPLQQN